MKKINLEKVARTVEKKINNPNLSALDISLETGISERTTSRIIKEELANIGEKSYLVSNLIDRNNNLHSAADTLIAEMLAKKDTNITIAQLTSLRDSTFKQNQVIEMSKNGKEDSKTIVIQI